MRRAQTEKLTARRSSIKSLRLRHGPHAGGSPRQTKVRCDRTRIQLPERNLVKRALGRRLSCHVSVLQGRSRPRTYITQQTKVVSAPHMDEQAVILARLDHLGHYGAPRQAV